MDHFFFHHMNGTSGITIVRMYILPRQSQVESLFRNTAYIETRNSSALVSNDIGNLESRDFGDTISRKAILEIRVIPLCLCNIH